jgi:putative hydrolase of the HAD superfamily
MDIEIDEHSVMVFDLDDTLYNETDYLRSAYMEIAKNLERKNWKPLFARMISMYRCNVDVFGYINDTYGKSKSELIRHYRNHDPVLSPFKGVLETFERIKEKKGKIGIITDGRSSTQRKKLEALDLLRFTDKILISEETGFEKPDERNYRLIEQAFTNSTYCYMADNIRKDFIAPNRLGWKTIGLIDNGLNVHRNGHLHFDSLKMPRHFVLSFEEINIV